MEREKFLSSIYLIIKNDKGEVYYNEDKEQSYGLVF